MLSEKPWKLDGVMRLLLGIGICICSLWFLVGVSLLLGGKQKPDESSFPYIVLITLGLDGSILLMVGIFLYRERVGWPQAFGFKTTGLVRAFGLSIITLPLVLLAAHLLQMASINLLEHLRVPAPEQEAVQTIRSASGGLDQIYLVFFTLLVAPTAEEMLFRGIIYPAIKQGGFPRAAWWVTSLTFGAIHLSPQIFVPLVVLSLALIFLYETTDNLLAPIFAHSLFNAANLWILFHNQAASHTGA